MTAAIQSTPTDCEATRHGVVVQAQSSETDHPLRGGCRRRLRRRLGRHRRSVVSGDTLAWIGNADINQTEAVRMP